MSHWGGDVVCVLHSQSRLQALDFWMRNPDYLANELLTEFETSGERDLLTIAQRIFDDREPDLRRLPRRVIATPFASDFSATRCSASTPMEGASSGGDPAGLGQAEEADEPSLPHTGHHAHQQN